VGSLLARRGAVVLCGGLGGVMDAAARGARAAGGICVGLLPGWEADDASAEVTLAIPTGLGEMRNALLARGCAAMIAVGGGYGTLTEVAWALRLHRPVAAIGSWRLRRGDADTDDTAVYQATSPEDAVSWVLRSIGR
jgi:uncharacterized protein (TIGR00725 family)